MSAATRPTTIRDVATGAGVSIKTVSRVLRNEPGVSAEVRQRVREVSARLMHVPNASASQLASASSNAIGLVFVDETNPKAYEYRMRMLMGALTACNDAGFGLRLESVKSNDADAGAQLVGRVRRREAGAYVLASYSASLPGLLDALRDAGVPYAAMAGYLPASGPVTISPDDRAAMRSLTRLVIRHGHKRIAFVRGDEGWQDAEERLSGFLDAMAEAGLDVDAEYIVPGEFDFETGRRAGTRLLDLQRPPTAVVASSDDIAAGVIAVAHERGLRLPEQLSVTGFDDSDLAHKMWPPLTTVQRPIQKMVEIAVRQLIGLVKPARPGLPAADLRPVQLHSEIVVRGSLAAISKVPTAVTAGDAVFSQL